MEGLESYGNGDDSEDAKSIAGKLINIRKQFFFMILYLLST